LSQQRGSTWTAAGRKKGAGHREKDKEYIDTESFKSKTSEKKAERRKEGRAKIEEL